MKNMIEEENPDPDLEDENTEKEEPSDDVAMDSEIPTPHIAEEIDHEDEIGEKLVSAVNNEDIEKNHEHTTDLNENHGELSMEDIENIDALLEDIDENEQMEPEKETIIARDEKDDDVKIVSVKELTERTVKRNTIEAALLAAQRPIGVEEISIKLEMSKTEIQGLIQELAEDYMDRTTAIEIVQIGEGYSMQIKPEYTERIAKFASGGLIPKAVMRTLTIIAVKQPLLKSLLVKMRGSTAYEHCKFLIDRGFVSTYKKGRSSILETTDQFADTFGLSRDTETLKAQLIEQLDIQTLEEESEDEDSTNPQSENIVHSESKESEEQ
jgi:segregation and condensation protein B